MCCSAIKNETKQNIFAIVHPSIHPSIHQSFDTNFLNDSAHLKSILIVPLINCHKLVVFGWINWQNSCYLYIKYDSIRFLQTLQSKQSKKNQIIQKFRNWSLLWRDWKAKLINLQIIFLLKLWSKLKTHSQSF